MEKTTASDLAAGLTRLLEGGFVVAESRVFILSRDGESLRPVGNLAFRKGKNDRAIIGRGPEDGETVSVSELLFFCRALAGDCPVKLIADGFSEANAEDLETFKLAAEILSLKRNQAWIDYTETSVVLCT